MSAGWKSIALGDLVHPAQTWNPLRSRADGVFDYIDLSAVDQDQKLITEARQISCGEAPSRARQIVESGDVLVSTVRPNLNGVARVTQHHDGATASTGFCVLRAKEPVLVGSYLFHWVKSPQFVADMVKKATGASYPAVSDRIIFESRIPLPPLAEQRRISEVLDKAEALRVKRRAALAQLDTLTQSLFLDLFGDPIRNQRNWPAAKVSELCALARGSSPRPQGDPRFFGGPVPRLMVADITRDGWLVTPAIDSLTLEGSKRSRLVQAGTVVMAVSGNVGLVSRLAIDACVHDGFVAFTELDEGRCQPGFLLALLHFSKALHDKHKAGAIFINLTTADIKSMSLPLPPLDLQREFARRVAAVEKLKTAQRASLAELDALFASLQHRAFRGEL
jgi:restriction endonuclease S subunit